ncbi:MAG TPA: DUF2333 family protein [Dongiaceae bacterium]|nr:DUF2333 family protein [Dongiaceae bacterium]
MNTQDNKGLVAKVALGVVGIYLLFALGLGVYWSDEPEIWNVNSAVEEDLVPYALPKAQGFATTSTLIRLADLLLEKPGGYLTNDITPPGLWLDNIPNWEYGVLVQIRDMTRSLRKDIARSQSTSIENADLAVAEPQFNFDSSSFWFPSTESEYRRGILYLKKYQKSLLLQQSDSGKFYARADNLRNYLADVETRLGSMSQRLSSSVGKEQLNMDIDSNLPPSATMPAEMRMQTGFLELDDIFYEARGASFALIHLLKAIEIDFHDVLVKKNAVVSVQQIIRELEASQQPVMSPMILNGSGFGMLANHSLVMANYISRANAAIIDLRRLLEQG